MEHYIQLLFALSAGIIFFLFSKMNLNLATALIVILIPFQIIDSRYGSINFALSLVYWIALLSNRKGRVKLPFPLVLSFFLIIIAMIPALYETPIFLLKSNVIYIVNFAQNIIMTMLVVSFARDKDSIIKLLYLLGIGNILVIIFFFIQAAAGKTGIVIGGIQEFFIHSRIDEQQRLIGPFNGSQASVAYLISQSMICIYALITFAKSARGKIFWLLLLIMNTALVIGTGTRSGLLGYILAIFFMFILFWQEMGLKNSLKFALIASLCLTLMTFAVVKFTDYNRMLERLENTKIYGFEVDTRKGLIPMYWQEIKKHPIIGHRPMCQIPTELKQNSNIINQKVFTASPPHNFYIYVLFTTGFVGLTAHLIFFAVLFYYLFKAKAHWSNKKTILRSFPALLIGVFGVFLILEFFISYLRFALSDLQDYMFTLFGIFISTYYISQQLHQENNET